MDGVGVIYKSTDVNLINDKRRIDEDFEAKHYVYLYPELKCDILEKKGFFRVIIDSQFEYSHIGVPYKISTTSEFELERFIPNEDRFTILEDYIEFAYRKHIKFLIEKLGNHVYIDRIRKDIELRQYKNSLETILFFAEKDFVDLSK